MPNSWKINKLPWTSDPGVTLSALAGGGESAWLDSATADSRPDGEARTSMLCFRPVAAIEQFPGEAARFVVGARCVAESGRAWDLWRDAHSSLPVLPTLPVALSPGWVGAVGFEAARQLERLPASTQPDLGLPLVRLALYDRAIVLDHQRRTAHLVATDSVRAALGLSPCSDGEELERIASACLLREAVSPVHPAVPCLRDEIGRGKYEGMVVQAREYIAAGDIYQVNLARRVQIAPIDDALSAYRAVRRSNPAAYAALLRWPDSAIASFSPELFLRVRGRDVRTRPIKGTRPRTGDPDRDRAYRRELLTSAKEAAELVMIVDLHRNDLGRVCEFGSVRVEHARRIETHPTVFHTIADVVGRLAADRDALDLLAACFPAGSISGVPKIRALEIIDELEPVARGAYTGAIGVLGLDGQMTFNVAIRTLQIRERTATLYVGGGIVADSDPAAEYEETRAKAAGILCGLGVAERDVTWESASSSASRSH